MWFVTLPLSKVEPTPFQGDVSPAHVKEARPNAQKFNIERVKESDVAAAGGPPPSEGDEG